MGCDAHFFLERKIDNEEWHLDPGHRIFVDPTDNTTYPMSIPSLQGRNYYFFGVLAGMRYMIRNPIAPNRGLPSDASSILKNLYSQREYSFHSATWLTPAELKKGLKMLQRDTEREAYSYSESIRDILDVPAENAFNYDDAEYHSDINGAVLNYIRIHKEWDKVQNMMLGTKCKTQYRIILWFDS